MLIKRNTLFFLQAKPGKKESYIRMQIRWGKNLVTFNTGYAIEAQKWSTETQRCKKGSMNEKRFTHTQINKEIQRLDNLADVVFKSYEDKKEIPTLIQFKNQFNLLNGKIQSSNSNTLSDFFREFCQEQSTLNGWSLATIKKFRNLHKHIVECDANIQLSDFNQAKLISIVNYLHGLDLKNSTIEKNIKLLKWFLKWAYRKKYLTCGDFEQFNPKLKTVTDKAVVFLTWNELMTLYNFKFPSGRDCHSQVRDVFCFQCFTSLRYSDVFNLKKSDISNDKFTIVTIKTASTITIELNKYSKAILEKYKDLPADKALPVISNQKFNKFLKEVCFVAGINSPVTIAYYKGSERIEETKPKYELIGTHTGRRTFICNALAMGIAPQTVMEWTGHSDYKSMKPYIGVANEEKRKAMQLFDEK